MERTRGARRSIAALDYPDHAACTWFSCCYEVDRPVIEPLRRAFPDRWEQWVAPAGPGKWMLDLWAANEAQLTMAGCRVERITNPRLCTACRRDLLFSYRKEGSGGRLVTVAALPALWR